MRFQVGISSTRGDRGKKQSISRSNSISSISPQYKYRKIKKYSPLNHKGHPGDPAANSKGSKIKKTLGRIFGIILGIGLMGSIATAIFVAATLANISAQLPNPDKLMERNSAMSTKIYDRKGPEKGKLLYTVYGAENREFVKLEKIPIITRWSLLAAEDREFYDHKGVDLIGIAKATIDNYVLHKQAGGASTISQQLVRGTILSDIMGDKAYERTVKRKVIEALTTMKLEQEIKKDDILQMYMNEVSMGGTIYGFQTASKMYFGKDVSQLDLAESALLAGIIQAPGAYSPLWGTEPEMAKVRQTYVLDQMYKNRDYIAQVSKRNGQELKITKEMIDAAKSEQLVYKQGKINIDSPHFVFYVEQELIKEFGKDRMENGGLIVTTSLDYSTQKIAEQEIKAGIDKFRSAHNVNNGALVAINPKNGDVLAMVGSYDYWKDPNPNKIDVIDGNVNIITSLRQHGSAVKPMTYLTAFHKGYSPALLTPDIQFKMGYKAENWDGKFQGLLLARKALVESRNLSALYTLDLVGGADEFVKTAETLGITTLTNRSQYGLSITLGAAEMTMLEHADAYAVYASGGVYHAPRPILKIQNYKGEDITPEKWKDTSGKRVWDEKEIYLLNWILCDLGGQGRSLGPQYYSASGQKFCGKTGTTTGPKDLTTFLYYPNLVVGVWIGNNNNALTIGRRGSAWATTVPLPMAYNFMSRVVGKYGKSWYSRPGGIVSGSVCKYTGLLAKADSECPKVSSVFIQGHLPATDDSYVKKAICKETGLVATNEAEANAMGLIEYKTYLKITLPLSKYQSQLDAYLRKSKYFAPFADIPGEGECPLHLGPGNAPTISFATPVAGSEFKPSDMINISVHVNSLHGVSKVDYYFDSTFIGSSTAAPFGFSYTVPGTTSLGNHTLRGRVVDIDGKTGEATVDIQISNVAPSVKVKITNPGSGAILTPGTLLSATLTGDYGMVSTTQFIIVSKINPALITKINGSKAGGGSIWSASWLNPDHLPTGTYWLYAESTIPGEGVFQSAPWYTVSIP